MTSTQPIDSASQARLLSTRKIVFLVIAAAAPMAAMVGNVPLALLRGNGIGLPAAFVAASVVLVCFAVGYATMSKRVLNSGAFYTYVARGLGNRAIGLVGKLATGHSGGVSAGAAGNLQRHRGDGREGYRRGKRLALHGGRST